jgi:AAA+ ATPase superfamily predicted ATPase
MELFDLRPKKRREDLFDRERELELLHRGIERGYPVVSVLGIRRIGKTSLLKVLLSELSGLYVDMRGVARRSDLEARLTDSMESSLTRLRKFLEGMGGKNNGLIYPDKVERQGLPEPGGSTRGD